MTYPSAMLKPATADLVVRDPATRQPLAAAGELKPIDTYWSRRLVAGDVVVVPSDAPASQANKPAGKPALKTV